MYEQYESLLGEIRVCEEYDSSFVKKGIFRVSSTVYEQYESLLGEIRVCEEYYSSFVRK